MPNTPVQAAATGLPIRRKRKRTRSYSVTEAERMTLKMPLYRNYTYLETAYATAQWLEPDPVFWLERAAMAGMLVDVRRGELRMRSPGGSTDEGAFLSIWLSLYPGGKEAVADLLKKRARATGDAA